MSTEDSEESKEGGAGLAEGNAIVLVAMCAVVELVEYAVVV